MMENPLLTTTSTTTSVCEGRHNVLITALFWHSKQSKITYMSHIDNKNNSWIKKKSHNSILFYLWNKSKGKLLYTFQTIYSHYRNYIQFKNKFSWIENTQITPLHIGIHIKQLLRELRYSVCVYIHLNVFTSTVTFLLGSLLYKSFRWINKCTCQLIRA